MWELFTNTMEDFQRGMTAVNQLLTLKSNSCTALKLDILQGKASENHKCTSSETKKAGQKNSDALHRKARFQNWQQQYEIEGLSKQVLQLGYSLKMSSVSVKILYEISLPDLVFPLNCW